MKETFEMLNHLSPLRIMFYAIILIVLLSFSAHIITAAFQTIGVIFQSIFKRK